MAIGGEQQGMVIDSEVFFDLCNVQKKCKFFTMDGKTAVCENPRCFLSNWYSIRYKGEGHNWEDMHFNTKRGCFCFEDMGVFRYCPAKAQSGSACNRVIDVFPTPD